MKTVTSTIACIFFCVAVNAQSFFINAGIGAGTSSTSARILPGHSINKNKAIFSDQAQLHIGTTRGRILWETGIDYLRTGSSFYVRPFSMCWPLPDYLPDIKYTIKYDHLLVPLIVSYAIRKDKKLSFYPGVGIEGAYNFKGKVETTNSNIHPIDPEYHEFHRVSLLLLLKCNMQYAVNARWGIWGGLSYQNMLASFISDKPGISSSMGRAYDHALLFNAGVTYNFHTVKANAAN